MERVDRAIRQETNVEQMLQNVLETVLSIFESDRTLALLSLRSRRAIVSGSHGGDSTRVSRCQCLERRRTHAPQYRQGYRNALASEDPFTETNGTNKPVNLLSAEQFGVQAQMFQAVYPRTGKPWVFGMHQCSHARAWTEDERQRFKEVGRRVADGLSNVLFCFATCG